MTLTLLDGSHKFVAAHTGVFRETMEITNNAQAETAALVNFMETLGIHISTQVCIMIVTDKL